MADLARHPLVVLIATMASIATILFFATGRNLPDLVKSWLNPAVAAHGTRSQPRQAIAETGTATWESEVLNAVTKRVEAMAHPRVVIDSVQVDAGGVTTIRCYGRDRKALTSFAEELRADPVFAHTETSPLTPRPGGDLFDLTVTAFVDNAKLPDLSRQPES